MRAVVLGILACTIAVPALAETPAPKAKSCVNIANIRDTRVIDDQTIDFVMSDGRTLRNNLPNKCPGLKINRTFGYATAQSQLCNVDIITVIVQAGGPTRGVSCGLGQFTPVAPPAK
jgi:hypothetical protein